jgi:uncharacterized protein (TIGR02147 family)
MNSALCTTEITAFFDYRAYLAAFYEQRKAADPRFSYRYFAQKAGLSSFSLYRNIVLGYKNMTERYIPGFAKALGLDAKQEEYFRLMVAYTHAVSDQARQELFKQMLPYLPSKSRQVKESQREFYAKWHHVVVHQALGVLNVKDDFRELAKRIVPAIGVVEAKRSIKLLSELDLIAQDKQGYWKPTGKDLVGGREVGALYIHNFQNSMIDLAKDAPLNFTADQRITVTETFAVSKKAKEAIHTKIAAFHKELVAFILSQAGEEEVLQFNLQYFPLWKVNGGTDEA